ncbi:hypothetical protein KC331_g11021 [Hortaea werneckii]|uniref:J domain-containing protein n=1 Tax=Hortaea werneckii TaxID=91943 RepID=A0A3M7D2C5_HORWE|nr:hypothetical protein KC331_g11021 [Hortaea werneckii]KAI7719832.1 hypothetical protein KC353_g2669 [Hortaea werneckii]RMY58107.1 hypothetical protein D0865_02780 [Hortaea werneckii]
MSSPLPEDPYISLGVAKDATPQTIKTQYRKLVLKFHPDKVQDPALKQAAVDEFHKIQKAYEVVGDEDKRAKYDAQCKLAQLRKEVMERERMGENVSGRADKRSSAAYDDRASMYSSRPAKTSVPNYEERRPGHASTGPQSDYFDAPRPAPRKEAASERTSKRPSSRLSTREDRDLRARAVGREAERAKNREREARRDREIHRERDRKTAYEKVANAEEDSDSESEDEYEIQDRRRKREDEMRRWRATQEQARREREEAARAAYYDSEERARKLYSQYDEAREYIGKGAPPRKRSPEDDRQSARPASSKDKVEYIKRSEGRPSVMIRRGSVRSKTSSREPADRRNSQRRASNDDAAHESRKPPPLTTSKSSPADVKLPFEKQQRAQSMQVPQDKEDVPPPPRFRRAETMPHMHVREGRKREPQKASGLRQTETTEGLPSPGPTPSTSPSKYTYRQEYADDNEYPTPDGYRTELREPGPGAQKTNRYTRSPSPMREAPERPPMVSRTSSARYPPSSAQRPNPSRRTSTSYVYSPSTQGVEAYNRPSMTREPSSRMYGEVPSSATRDRGADARSPRQTHGKYSPPPESVRYSKDFRPEDIRVQSGYGSRRPSTASTTRPSYSRHSSYNPVFVK